MPRDELFFGVVVAIVHAGQHLYLRLLPPLIPILVVDFEATLWQLGLLVSIYMFAGGVFQAPMGILADRYDRMYLLIPAFLAMGAGYLIFVFAGVFGSVVPSVGLFNQEFSGEYIIMAVGMIVSGIGFSAIHPVGYTLISANVSGEHKGKILGMWGSGSKAGDAIAPIIIGILIIVVSWEWILIGIGLFGFVIAAWLLSIFRKKGYDTTPPVRAQSGNDFEAGSNWKSNPRTFLIPIVVMIGGFFCLLFATNGFATFAPVFVTDVYGYSFTIGSITLEPASVGSFYYGALLITGALSQLIVGGLTDIFDHRSLLIVLFTIAGITLVGLSYLSLSPLLLLIVFAILGFSLFGMNAPRDALISEITPAVYEGRTFGYIWTFALGGSSVFPVLIGYVADIAGLRVAIGMLAIGAFGGLICVSLLFSSLFYHRETKNVA